jgi:K+-sensing histidine kinase KdpD
VGINKDKNKGAGLGLYLTKIVLDKINGSIVFNVLKET